MALLKRPTIIDVAAAAGVSKSTVSLVIRDPEAVKPETRVKVRDAMERLGYVYNHTAATMRSGKVRLIGLIINDLRNPFFTEFAASLQMALSKAGYAAVIANTDEDPGQQQQMIEAMIGHNVAGLIISPAYGDVAAAFDALSHAQIPAIQVMRQVDDRTDQFPFLAPDYFHAGQEATRHLIAQGARHIAFIGGLKGRSVTLERLSGYQSVLKQQGLTPLIFNGQTNRAFGQNVAQHLFADHAEVDAVLCFNDFVALGVSACLRNHRLLHPDKRMRIVGFDDIEEARHAYPPVSSVQCGISDLATRAAEHLLRWLHDGIRPAAEERTPSHFIGR